jgi:uncharacterized damage-inducible protein DinB
MSDTTAGRPRFPGLREHMAHQWETETEITRKVLAAYPAGQGELRPHERSKTARELAWAFPLEMRLVGHAIRGDFQPSGQFPTAPATWDEVVDAFERQRAELLPLIRNATDEQLGGTIRFFTGPGQMGDIPVVQFCWFLLHDHIHHRGQLSVYLRMAGGKVPSIYGPSADEPWM